MNAERHPLALAYRHRRILVATMLDELRQRYAGTTIGLAWVVLYPAVLIALYVVVYLFVFRVQPPGVEPGVYVLRIMCGLVAVMGFNEGLNAGTGTLAANRTLLLNAVFPSELLPLRSALAAQGTAVVGLALCAGASVYLGLASWTLFLMPVFWLLELFFIVGLAWVTSLANLVARDVQQVLAFLTISLLIASPIAFTPDMAPGPLKVLIYVNPLSYFVLAQQALCVEGRLPDAQTAAVAVVLAGVAFTLGFAVFRRAKRAVLDYV